MMTAGKPFIRAEGVTLSGVPEGMRTAGGWNFGEPHFTWVPKVKAFLKRISQAKGQRSSLRTGGNSPLFLCLPEFVGHTHG